MGEHDIQVFIGVQADIAALQQVQQGLEDIGIVSERVDASLDDASNRELRRIREKITALEKLKRAYAAGTGKVTTDDIRRAQESLSNELEAIGRKHDNIQGARNEEILKGIENQKKAAIRAEDDKIRHAITKESELIKANNREIRRIQKRALAEEHSINTAAERRIDAARGDKRITEEARKVQKEQLDLVNRTLNARKKELITANELANRRIDYRLQRANEKLLKEDRVKYERIVKKLRSNIVKDSEQDEAELAQQRIRNERVIQSIRDRGRDRERLGETLAATRHKKGSGVGGAIAGAALPLVGGNAAGLAGFVGAAGYFAAFHALYDIIRNVIGSTTELYHSVQNLERAFVSLNEGSLVKANVLLADLDKATLFAIKKSDQLRIANLALNTGVSALTDNLASIVGNIRTVSLALGRDMVSDIERVIKAGGKMETELLDELGIATRAAEAFEKYAQSVGKSVQELSQYERIQAFNIHLAQELQDKADRLVSVIHLQQQAVGELKRSWEAFTVTIGKTFSGAFIGIIDKAQGMISMLREFMQEDSEKLQFVGAGELAAIAKEREDRNNAVLIRRRAKETLRGLVADDITIEKATRFRGQTGEVSGQIPDVELTNRVRGIVKPLETITQRLISNPSDVRSTDKEAFTVAEKQLGEILKAFPDTRAGQFQFNQMIDEIIPIFKRLQAVVLLETAEKERVNRKREAGFEPGPLQADIKREQELLRANLGELSHEVKILNKEKGLTTRRTDYIPEEFRQIQGLRAQRQRLSDKIEELFLGNAAAGEAARISARPVFEQIEGAERELYGAALSFTIPKELTDAKQYTELSEKIKFLRDNIAPLAEEIGESSQAINAVATRASASLDAAFKKYLDTILSSADSVSQQSRLLKFDLSALRGTGETEKAAEIAAQVMTLHIGQQDKEAQRVLQAIEEARKAGNEDEANRIELEYNSPERKAARELETKILSKALKDGVAAAMEPAVEGDDDKPTKQDKAHLRELRQTVNELINSLTRLGEIVLEANSYILTLVRESLRTNAVQGISRNLFDGKKWSEGISQFSLASGAFSLGVGLFENMLRREEEERQRLLQQQERRFQAESELYSNVHRLLSGLDGLDRVLTNAFEPFIREFEGMLQSNIDTDSGIKDLFEVLKTFLSGESPIFKTLSDSTGIEKDIGDLTLQEAIIETRNQRGRVTPELNGFLRALRPFFAANTPVSDLLSKAVELSKAFQSLTDQTKGVEEAQKQEVKDSFNIARERVRAEFSAKFSSDPYERSAQVQALRDALEGIRASEHAALSKIQGSGKLNIPKDFSDILTQFGEMLKNNAPKTPSGTVTVVDVDISTEATEEQASDLATWFNNLFELLDISDDMVLQKKVVAYIGRMDFSNIQQKTLIDLAEIVGINPQATRSGPFATELRTLLTTVPKEVLDTIEAVKIDAFEIVDSSVDKSQVFTDNLFLAIDTARQAAAKLIVDTKTIIPASEIADVSDFDKQLETKTWFNTGVAIDKGRRDAEQLMKDTMTYVPVNTITNVSDSDEQLKTQTWFEIGTSVDAGRREAEEFLINESQTIAASGVTALVDVDKLLENNSFIETSQAVDKGLAHSQAFLVHRKPSNTYVASDISGMNPGQLQSITRDVLNDSITRGFNQFTLERGHNRYHIDVGGMVSISSGGLANRIRNAVDSAVASAISNYEATISDQYGLEGTNPRSGLGVR